MSRGVIFIVASDKRLAGGHCDEEKTRKLEGGKFADMRPTNSENLFHRCAHNYSSRRINNFSTME